MRYSLFFILSLLFIFQLSNAQDQLVIDDRTGILGDELRQEIAGKLLADKITLTTSVDFSARCDYYFAKMESSGDELQISVEDCDSRVLGTKKLSSRVLSSPPPEQAVLISYALMDIVSYPGKYYEAGPYFDSSSEAFAAQRTDTALANEHDSRYFFAPSAYNLKKGELYYNTLYFLIHDFQYGISNNFSMGIGTTVIGLPMYFTPKLSIPIGDNSAVAVGDLLMLGTWGTDFFGNLAYGTFSTGGSDGNISLGAGHLYTSENELTGQTSSLVVNFNAMTRLSPYMFLLTENYVMSANFNRTAWYYDPSDPNYYDYVEESFVQRNTFWYGIIGVRVISKNRDFISWQFGLSYIVNFPGGFDVKYNSWEHDARTEMNMIVLPTVSFTIKFGGNM